MNVYILMETECRTIIGVYEKEEDAIAAAEEEARTCKYIEDGWENTFHIASEVLHESSKKQELRKKLSTVFSDTLQDTFK